MNSLGYSLQTFAETDRGIIREENEDSFLVHCPDGEKTMGEKGSMFIVADGVGGAACGKLASSLAVEIIRDSYYVSCNGTPLSNLKDAMVLANREIIGKALQEVSCKGMATTCTAFLVVGKQGYIAHLGDSRAYLFRGNSLRQITKDHTLVNKLVEDGLLTPEAAQRHPERNVITKFLGGGQPSEPDTYQLLLEDDDIVLLCSDGLYGMVSDEDIAENLSGYSVHEAGRSLINLAKRNGGSDNITVILLKINVKHICTLGATRPYFVINENRRNAKNSTLLACIITLLLFMVIMCFFSLSPETKRNAIPPIVDKIRKLLPGRATSSPSRVSGYRLASER